MSSRGFLQLIARRSVRLHVWRGQRVGLALQSPLSFLGNLLALLALDCQLILLPPVLKGEGLHRWGEEYGLVTLVEDFALATWGDSELSIAWDGPSLVVLTSGSQGSPKGVVHSWRNLYLAAQGFRQHFSLEPVVWGHSLPLFHVGGLMSFFRSFWAHGSYITGNNPADLRRAGRRCFPWCPRNSTAGSRRNSWQH